MNLQNSQKPVFIAVGVYIPGYSFTRVFASLFQHLSKHFTIHWIGIGYAGQKIQSEHYFLHPGNPNGGDIFAAYQAIDLATRLRAVSILVLNDYYVLKNYGQAFKKLPPGKIRTIAYVPFDGKITDPILMKECFFLDDLVVFHENILEEVQEKIFQLAASEQKPFDQLPTLHCRYHGVDFQKFYPSPSPDNLESLKQDIFHVSDAAVSLFILNANRFDPRKNIEASLDAFDQAYPSFEKSVYLCLHTPNLNAANKKQLQKLIANKKNCHRIILNPFGESFVDDSKLRGLYQACAIGVNTSLGEGWGMISFEHAACGAVQIVPSHSATGYLWKNVGVIIPADTPGELFTSPFLMRLPDTTALSRQFIQLVNDEKYRKQKSCDCYNFCISPTFDWENISIGWTKIILNSLDKSKRNLDL